jgi:hypothetical protein
MGAIDKRGMLVEFDFVRRVFTEEGTVTALAEHYHRERNHQGKVDVLLSSR